MAGMKAQATEVLNTYFTPQTFVLDGADEVKGEAVSAWVEAFQTDKYAALYHLGFIPEEKWFSPALRYLHRIAELLIRKVSRQPDAELSREAVQVDLTGDEARELIEALPFVIGGEYVDEAWLVRLWDKLLEVFRKEIPAYEGTVARYFVDHHSNINVVGRVFFHLVETSAADFPFAFMATYTTKPSQSKRAFHTPLKNALGEFEGDEKKLLALITTVVKAAETSAFIAALLESGELFAPIKLTSGEAYTFLKELPIYEEAGIICRIPNWWRKKANSVKLAVKVGETEPARLGLDAMMDFSPELSMGEDTITEEELRTFLQMAEGLIQYKGKWVEVDRKKIEAILAAFDQVKNLSGKGAMTLSEAMRLEVSMGKLMDNRGDETEIAVSNGQWLKSLKDRLLHPEAIEKIPTAETFLAKLRGYQEVGYRWLYQMDRFGFGACLADDMGLGKTVQIIAYLEALRAEGKGPVLLILPASLIGNWQTELQRFAPAMPCRILHPSGGKGPDPLDGDDFLYITTYGMAGRLEQLKDRRWDCLILDEAQGIKNPGTRQTKAVKAIPARMRIAMTGTPIENRLGDLWSLFDFLNQGLLGTAKEFTGFTKELQSDDLGYAKLRHMIQPFILRRLKTDKTIINDLPDKLEMNAYTTLTKRQIALYKELLREIENKLAAAEGISRKGVVLAGIMKFKQICNHPDQYLGKDEFKPEYSGKFEQLKEICETIHEKRERVLVFTQFKEMTKPLSEFLRGIFGKDGLVLHGETPVKKRKEMVDQFNGESYVPFMVLSLKAGGVGLNLTAANHVIHFDRWWNPAVENQATDRAFRIGQTKHVMVHKFVTKGTIEEKIDAMINDKQQLSRDILSVGGEAWITEYNNEELMELFALGGDLS